MDISQLCFGILSPEEVLAMSVCEIKYDKQKKINDLENTLYDPRMGPIEDDKPCPTCKKMMKECPGHFGHIVLNSSIIYPLTYGFKTTLNFLKCHCFQCSRLLFSAEKLNLLKLDIFKGIKKYNRIVDASVKVEVCWNCSSQVAKFYIQNQNVDPKIMMYYKLLSEKKSKENSMDVSIQEITRVFRGIPDEDLILLGFDPTRFRPKNLVLSAIPVLPTCSRPHVMTNGEKCDDDLTTIYRDICKANSRVLTVLTEEEKAKEIRSVSFYISVLMDNSKGRVKQPNGRPKKGIKERLATKKGLFRSNLMGKRTDYSGRTVVGGDPSLDSDQVAVPDCIAMSVTIPEMVCKFNNDRLTKLVNSNQAEFVVRTDENGQKRKINLSIATKTKPTPLFHGDTVYRERSGGILEKSRIFKDENGVLRDSLKRESTGTSEATNEVKITEMSQLRDGDRIVRKNGEIVENVDASKPRHFKLQIGDEVKRHLQDNDWVFLNRQPTLHVGSILGVRVKRQKVRRSIGIPLNITTPQNCDFDGKSLLSTVEC